MRYYVKRKQSWSWWDLPWYTVWEDYGHGVNYPLGTAFTLWGAKYIIRRLRRKNAMREVIVYEKKDN